MSKLGDAILARRPGLVPFVAGGDPSTDALPAMLRALADAGAAAVEVGFPFSDPIADGPTIQAAYQRALDGGAGVNDILAGVRAAGDLGVPAVAMVSQSIVHRRGPAAFCRSLADAGISGLLVPDLPAGPAADRVLDEAEAAGLETVLLVAPTTPEARRREIARRASGFVYYMSLAGITGARRELPSDLAENVGRLKEVARVPVCVGFGISTAEQVAAVAAVADGVIVGSALVRHVHEQGLDDPARAAGEFTRKLLGD